MLLFMPNCVPHLPPTRSIMPSARMASGPLLQILPSSRAPSTMMAFSDSFLAALPLVPQSALTAILSSHCVSHAAHPLIPAAAAAHHWKAHCSKSSLHKVIPNPSCILLALVAMEPLPNSSRNTLFRVPLCPLRHLQPCQQRLSHCTFLIQMFLQIFCPLQTNLHPYSSMVRAMPSLCQMMQV